MGGGNRGKGEKSYSGGGGGGGGFGGGDDDSEESRRVKAHLPKGVKKLADFTTQSASVSFRGHETSVSYVKRATSWSPKTNTMTEEVPVNAFFRNVALSVAKKVLLQALAVAFPGPMLIFTVACAAYEFGKIAFEAMKLKEEYEKGTLKEKDAINLAKEATKTIAGYVMDKEISGFVTNNQTPAPYISGREVTGDAISSVGAEAAGEGIVAIERFLWSLSNQTLPS